MGVVYQEKVANLCQTGILDENIVSNEYNYLHYLFEAIFLSIEKLDFYVGNDSCYVVF